MCDFIDMCNLVSIPENIRPLYLPAPFLSPPKSGMVIHFDEESGNESIVYPDTVWNQVSDPEKAAMRNEKNRARKQYRKDMAQYRAACELAFSLDQDPPEPPARPFRRHQSTDKSIPK